MTVKFNRIPIAIRFIHLSFSNIANVGRFGENPLIWNQKNWRPPSWAYKRFRKLSFFHVYVFRMSMMIANLRKIRGISEGNGKKSGWDENKGGVSPLANSSF